MPANQFEFLGLPHITAIGLTFALPLLLAIIVRRLASPPVTKAVCGLFAAMLLLGEVLNWVYRLTTGEMSDFIQFHLPLHVCDVALLAVALTLLCRHQTAYEIAYFWGLAGTANALVTPELAFGYPDYRFFQFFMAHGGIVAGALFATWGLGMKPSPGAVLRVFALLNLLALLLAGVNLILGSNYMYLSQAPVTESFFFFAPWPWYILILDGVALLLFWLLLLPFKLRPMARRIAARASRQDE